MISETTRFKTRIITRRAGYNYGSSLQAYAIQQIVEKQGFPNLIYNYDEYSSKALWRLRPFFDDFIFKMLQRFSWISRRLLKQQYQKLSERAMLVEKFKKFEREKLKITQVNYRSSQMLADDVADCDICICGSDQIWSPLLFDPVMFLDFCNKTSTKTIAYAPSFGVSSLHHHREKIRKLLLGINYISIREREGAEIIHELTARSAPVVLDPTLLLGTDEWRTVAQQPPNWNRPYILCYFLGKTNIPYRFLSEISQDTGYEILNICTFRTRNNIPGVQELTMSPEEFLGAVSNAKFVCTDSFHGSIFSILFARQFFTFERFGQEPTSQNSRIYTLLNTIGLADRIVPYNQAYNRDMRSINYKDVNVALQQSRKTSLEFLQNALNTRG